MARLKDPKSNRQKAFVMLDGMKAEKRATAITALKTQLNVGDSYAATLYAAHRTINKESGTMSQVFVVRDMKDGKVVKPYMKTINTFNPKKQDCKTREKAKQQYMKMLDLKSKAAAKLK